MDETANKGAADGKVKVELFDDPDRTGSYSASFTVYNLKDEANTLDLNADFFIQSPISDGEHLYMDLTTASGSVNIPFYFAPSYGTLRTYGQVCADAFGTADLAKKTIVLTVTGMDALGDEILQVTARLQAQAVNAATVAVAGFEDPDDILPDMDLDVEEW